MTFHRIASVGMIGLGKIISLPLCGVIKEVIKCIKVERGEA
jgi:hypothetical protein